MKSSSRFYSEGFDNETLNSLNILTVSMGLYHNTIEMGWCFSFINILREIS